MPRAPGMAALAPSARRCTLCGSVAASRLRDYQSPFVEHEYTLFRCGACASAFFDLDQHEVDLARIYEDYAEHEAPGDAHSFRRSLSWERQVAVLRRLHPGGVVRSVLDVGCQKGDFLLHWPGDVARLGVELSHSAAAVARARGLDVREGYLEETRIDRRFDVVSCYAILEHLPDPGSFLARLPQQLEADGVLALLLPTRECLKERVLSACGARWHMYCPPQHLSFPSRAWIDGKLAEQGLRLVRRCYTSGGMFNPFRGIRALGRLFGLGMAALDHFTPLNRLAVFDHMYSYYVRQR